MGSTPSLLLCEGSVPAAAARDDWWVGLPIMVMANGSSDVTGGGRLRSRFLSRSLRLEEDDEEEEEEGGRRVLVSARGAENGSPRPSFPLTSCERRGGGRVQASDRFKVSWVTVLSKLVKKGSSVGMCLQFHTDDSISGGPRDWEKAGNRTEGASISGGARDGRVEATDQTLVESSWWLEVRPEEGSWKAEKKGSTGRLGVCSLI